MGKHLKFGARPFPESLVPRLRITIPIHIVPGDGGWVIERFAVTFVSGGKTMDATRRSPFPAISADELQTALVYVMDYPDTDAIVIGARIKFRHGGGAKLAATTILVPRLLE